MPSNPGLCCGIPLGFRKRLVSRRSRLPEGLGRGDGFEAPFDFGGDLGLEFEALPVAGGGGELWGKFFADFFFDGGVKSLRSAGGDAVVHLLTIKFRTSGWNWKSRNNYRSGRGATLGFVAESRWDSSIK